MRIKNLESLIRKTGPAMNSADSSFLKLSREAFKAAAKVQPLAEPIDWMTNPRPEQWKLNGERVTFYWG